MSKIKICGLSRPQDIDAVNLVQPDYIGFVFAKSRRQVSPETAKILKNSLNPVIKAVGVFVNEKMETIVNLCNSHVIDIIQLHGDEDEDYINTLKAQAPYPIIKAIRVKDLNDVKKSVGIPCDYLLFDTYQDKQFGGSGKVFNWSYLTDIKRPYFLAGGIYSGNVQEAIKQCNPFCIDISSGVETNGYKDTKKIIDIVKKIRSGN